MEGESAERKTGVAKSGYVLIPVDLKYHEFISHDIDANVIDVVKSKSRTYFEQSFKAESEYFDRELESALKGDDEIKKQIETGGLIEVLTACYHLTKLGTGEHDEGANYSSVKEAFSVDQRPATKCTVFNKIFKNIYDWVSKKYRQDLGRKTIIIHTPALDSFDLPRQSETPGGRRIIHSFLTVVSRVEDSLVYTPIDPYHVNDTRNMGASLDFSEQRINDSLRAVAHEMGTKSEGGEDCDLARSILDAVDYAWEDDAYGLIDRAKRAVLLSYQIPKSVALEKRSRQKQYGWQIATQKGVEKKLEEAKSQYGMENPFIETLNNKCERERVRLTILKREYDEMINLEEDLRREIFGTAEALREHLVTSTDLEEVFLFVDLVDTIENQQIEKDDGFWEETLKRIDLSLLGRIDDFRMAYKNQDVGKKRRLSKSELFKRHFSLAWGKLPNLLQAKLTDEETAVEGGYMQYVKFRAKMLAFAAAVGSSAWVGKIKKDCKPESYEECLYRELSEELKKVGVISN